MGHPGRSPELMGLFPPGSAEDRDGMLTIGGCRADDLADEFGTPVLVVSESALRARAHEYVDGLRTRWPASRVVFASKAFPCTAVQRVMVEEGPRSRRRGAGEIRHGVEAGCRPQLLVLHGNAKSDTEIAMAVEHGIGSSSSTTTTTSTGWRRRPAGRDPGRPRPDHPGRQRADTHAHVLTGHEGSKFGLAPAAAAKADRRASSRSPAAHGGVHVHVGSQILAVEPFVDGGALPSPGSESSRSTTSAAASGFGTPTPTAPPSVAGYLDALVGAAREHLPAAPS